MVVDKLIAEFKRSRSWFTELTPWLTLSLCALTLLCWPARVGLLKAGQKLPFFGVLFFPLNQTFGQVLLFLAVILVLGSYAEHFLGHWKFLLIMIVHWILIGVILQTHFKLYQNSDVSLFLSMIIVGISVVAVLKAEPAPWWIQIPGAILAYIPLRDVWIGIISANATSWFWLALIGFATSIFFAFFLSRDKKRPDNKPLMIPWGTLGISTMLIVVYGIELFLSKFISGASFVSINVIDEVDPLTLVNSFSEALRQALISPFLHLSIMHLSANIIGLLVSGIVVERFFGVWRMLIIYFITGFGSALIAALWNLWLPFGSLNINTVGVGASGAIYGLFGAGLVYCLFAKNLAIGTKALFYYRGAAGIELMVQGLLTNKLVSEVADDEHLYGFLLGLLLGSALVVGHHICHRAIPLPGLTDSHSNE